MITLTEELKTKISTYFKNISEEELHIILDKYGLEKKDDLYLKKQTFTTTPIVYYNNIDSTLVDTQVFDDLITAA